MVLAEDLTNTSLSLIDRVATGSNGQYHKRLFL